MYCPKCHCTDISYVPADGGATYHYFRSAGAKLIQLGTALFRKHTEDTYGPECICLNCGNRWYPEQQRLRQKHEVHLTKLMGNYEEFTYPSIEKAYMRMNRECILIYHSEKNAWLIPLEHITAVRYQKSVGPLNGWLSVRYVPNRNKPFPKDFFAAKKDKTTILCPFEFESLYYDIFTTLNAIAEENAKAGRI